MLEECELDNCRGHYKLNIPMCELFQEDKQQLLHLPELPFECCKYRRLPTDHYGKFCIDNCHFYNIGPQYADSELWVRIGAFAVSSYHHSPTTRSSDPEVLEPDPESESEWRFLRICGIGRAIWKVSFRIHLRMKKFTRGIRQFVRISIAMEFMHLRMVF